MSNPRAFEINQYLFGKFDFIFKVQNKDFPFLWPGHNALSWFVTVLKAEKQRLLSG